MKLHKVHLNWLWEKGEAVFVIGCAIGRVNYHPEAKWLYSFRLFLAVFKVEILWKTGCCKHED